MNVDGVVKWVGSWWAFQQPLAVAAAISISISVVTSVFPSHRDAEALLRAADAALFRASVRAQPTERL
jgi:hypothetical protein